MGELAGRVAIVTGGSRGIGAAAAAALAAAGAAVTIAARDGAAASRVADAIVGKGGKAIGVTCDVSDFAAVEAMLAETNRSCGTVDILVNNAAIVEPIGFLADSDPAAWRRNIEINLIGPYHAVRATLPQMLASNSGTIIDVSSGAAHRPMEGWAAYCSAKAGLAMLTEAITLESGALGIRVFGFSPGVIDTDMQVKVRASGINRVSRIPRADLAPVDHPAAAILYLCTTAADDLAGREVSLSDPAFRRRIGLS
ncbi:MAG TPA: SDR family oxidoreductase [Stellaceae bacterium]|jgi:NAD(P)-dependent dehydrogenase (short-subunit alcohol dehydrogenase family)|nr:SDR family oxidoreductase [Stellaceae bacterium]